LVHILFPEFVLSRKWGNLFFSFFRFEKDVLFFFS